MRNSFSDRDAGFDVQEESESGTSMKEQLSFSARELLVADSGLWMPTAQESSSMVSFQGARLELAEGKPPQRSDNGPSPFRLTAQSSPNTGVLRHWSLSDTNPGVRPAELQVRPLDKGTRADTAGNNNFDTKDERYKEARPEVQSAGSVRRTTGGEMVIDYPGGEKSRRVTFDDGGNAVKIVTRDSTGTTVELSRRESSWFMKVQGWELPVKGEVKISPQGDFAMTLPGSQAIRTERPDGSFVLESPDSKKIEFDRQQDPVRVTTKEGHQREFKYTTTDGKKVLQDIVEIRKSGDREKSEVWTRKPGTSDFVALGLDGKIKTRAGVSLSRETEPGSYRYRTPEGKEVLSRPGEDTMSGGLASSVEDARQSFSEIMKRHLPERNGARLGEMMKGFEERMAERAALRKMAGQKSEAEIDKWVANTVRETYDRLKTMVDAPDGDTFYDRKTRLKLAENFMFHAMDPTTSDQGPASQGDMNGHGTCWIQSGHIWGMTQHPGAMADLLAQVALKGEYKTKNNGESDPSSRTFKFSPEYLSFRQGTQEAQWTIESACDMWKETPGMKRQCDGDRSPVGKIFDYVIPLLGGNRRPGDLDGGMYEDNPGIRNPRYHTGTRSLMYRVTGDAPLEAPFKGGRLINGVQYPKGHLIDGDIRKSLLEKGSVLNYTDGHLRSLHLRKFDGHWVLYQDDQHGELGKEDNKDTIVARITDIHKWAAGDRQAEVPAKAKPQRKRLAGSGDSDAVGAVTPRRR